LGICAAVFLLSLAGVWGVMAAGIPGVRITEQTGKLRVEVNGELFSEYHYQGGSRPCFYPLLGPGGLAMTRNWPMKDVAGEDHDHVHHRSFWWAHGDLNGVDFWSEGDKAGRTVHDQFVRVESGRDAGLIQVQNKLLAKDGKLIATAEETTRVYSRPEDRLMDFAVTVHASQGELVFGDTKEGTMALRLAETMRLAPNKSGAGKGHIVNSEGVRDGATWGKRAKWVDYYGPVNDQIVGVAIFDHPQNPRHPTWWHVRDYGLFAANPFGLHDFEKQPAGAGKLTVPAGERVTFRYRFYFHRGDEQAGHVAERYAEYVQETAKGK
jgi:hypothetical protein